MVVIGTWVKYMHDFGCFFRQLHSMSVKLHLVIKIALHRIVYSRQRCLRNTNLRNYEMRMNPVIFTVSNPFILLSMVAVRLVVEVAMVNVLALDFIVLHLRIIPDNRNGTGWP